MSKFNDGFDAFCLRQETKSLESALKNEVGLVQGGRQRRKSNYKKHDDEVEWPEESCHPEEDPSTRLIKMECKIPTRKKKERNSKGKPKKKIPNVIRNETRRVLTGFCFQNGLSFYFPLKLDEESSSIANFSSRTKYFPRRTKTRGKKLLKKRQNRLLTRRLRGGTGGRGKHPPISTPHERRPAGAGTGGGGQHPPISPPHERRLALAEPGEGGHHPPISTPHERRPAGAGTGGGGRHPPISTPNKGHPAGAGTGGGGQHSPTSTPNESHPAGAGTGGEGQHPPISTPNERHPAGPGTEIELVISSTHFEKTFSSIFNSPTSTHDEPLKTTVSSHQIPEEDHYDHDRGAHKKSPMSPGIRHYTKAGKMKTHRLSLDDNSFHQPSKKRRESASPSPWSTSTLKSERRVKMIESDDQHDHDHFFSDRHSILRRPEKTSLTPSMEVRSRKSLATRRDSTTFSVVSRFKSKGHLISRVSQIRETSGDFERDTEWLQWTSSEDDDQLDEHQDSAQQQQHVDHFSMVINSDGNHENRNYKSEFKIKQKKKTKTIQPELKPFINSIKGLEKLGFWMGLNPYQKVVRGNGSVQVKWVPKSWRFAAVGLNALFFLALTLSASNTLIYIYSIQEPLPVSL
ncbi:unnamed protein product [Orchesella dallaii]|uniref:Uncharacterized protein n=1 Tax=Orchesella dallaii TaxID=48710 RepID=A0ABP1RYT0_9HEXA